MSCKKKICCNDRIKILSLSCLIHIKNKFLASHIILNFKIVSKIKYKCVKSFLLRLSIKYHFISLFYIARQVQFKCYVYGDILFLFEKPFSVSTILLS